jgi:excisionase family DNA binding protein
MKRSERPARKQATLEPMALTKVEAAESLGISVRTLQSEMAARRIKWKQIGKLVRFHPEHLRRFMLDLGEDD